MTIRMFCRRQTRWGLMIMNVLGDTRGKIFTDVIRKTKVKAEIRTKGAVIYGTIHIHPEKRVSDELNSEGHFLAVTDARLVDDQGERSVPFVALSKPQIVLIIPDEEPVGSETDG
jgi:hypothetical protein